MEIRVQSPTEGKNKQHSQRRSRLSVNQPVPGKPSSQATTNGNGKASIEESDSSAGNARRNSGSRRARLNSSGQVFPLRPRSQPPMQMEAEQQQQPTVEEHLTQPPSPLKEAEGHNQRRPARLPASAYQTNIFPFRPRGPITTPTMQVEIPTHINMVRIVLQSRKRTLDMPLNIK